MQGTMGKQAVEWLAAAAEDPGSCKRQWDKGADAVLLEAGQLWDVLSVPEHLGLGALDLLRRARRRASGPVLVNCGARRVGFFLPPDPVTKWVGPGVRHVGRGSWVAVPPPARSAGRRLEWLLPPDGTGTLYDPGLVERALREAVGTAAVPRRLSRAWAGRRR
ncbi:bifunctional DNA primase/polymerase [Streptomyces sp. NPDC048581]|uniref:bifunctional DNA primase/polymerase n=1 Tax=unclassified Streptomyces TaxID=2593676 RepID=UPI003721AC00